MAKIMLVEDDTNLSEIYQARLTAEGYEIVSAHDGEEALALAAKEKPDLIVSDVMMPKISGFEMLDILRNTEGLKETKVIMLTALGQADDKSRAEGLGADRYLVKSQVTLEDIVKAAQELLTGSSPETAGTVVPAAATPAPAPTPTPVAVAMPPVPTPVPVAPAAVVQAPAPTIPVATPAPAPVPVAPMPVAAPATAVAPMPAPVAPAPVAPPVVTPPVQPPVAAPTTPMPVATPAPAPTPTPVAVAMPPVPTPVPVAPAAPSAPPVPTPPVDQTAAADNKLMTDAVEDLLEGAAGKTAPAPATPTPAPVPAPDMSATPDTPNNATVDNSNTTGNDNVNIAHKKIIQPITNGAAPERPSLESLLADEERKNQGMAGAPMPNSQPVANTPVTNVPHQPGHIITPSAADSLSNGNGIDPNSIAL